MGERVTLLKIDVDKNKESASQFQVRGVSTMFLFQNGKQIWRQSCEHTNDEIVRNIVGKSA